MRQAPAVRPATGQPPALGSAAGGRLYALAPATAFATALGPAFAVPLTGSAFGFDVDPVADVVRITGNDGQNLRLSPDTGQVIGGAADTPLAYAPGDPNFGSPVSVVGLGYSNDFLGAATTTAYGYDFAHDALVTLGPPGGGTSAGSGQVHTVGPSGLLSGDVGDLGLDVRASDNTLFADVRVANKTGLYALNPSTGAAA